LGEKGLRLIMARELEIMDAKKKTNAGHNRTITGGKEVMV